MKPEECPRAMDSEMCSQYQDMLLYQHIEHQKFLKAAASDPIIANITDAVHGIQHVAHFIGKALDFVIL